MIIREASRNTRLPLSVAIMDDDVCALKWYTHLLTHDLRFTVCIETESPSALLTLINTCQKVNFFLVDVEYSHLEPSLQQFLFSIRQACPDSYVICLSQYGEIEDILTAIRCGTKGFLLKQDVRLGIGSALMFSLQAGFLITQNVLTEEKICKIRLPAGTISLVPWRSPSHLTPQLQQVIFMRILFGMSAPWVALKLRLTPGTVEKYLHYSYQRLRAAPDNDYCTYQIDMEELPAEIQAFHRFIMLPEPMDYAPEGLK